MLKRVLFFALLFLASHAVGWAQAVAQSRTENQPPATTQNAEQEASTEDADLAITATVTARELRFEVVPNPTVEFSGKPERETVWEARRENLPPTVEPGVTYRDIGIRLKITSIFPDIDRIVSEALGEVPTTDALPEREDNNQKSAPANAPPSQTTTQSKEGRPQ